MGFSITTQSATPATPKTHAPRFSCRVKNAYRGLQVENPGRRFYSATLGRWINRDPIGEDGFNLLRRQHRGPAFTKRTDSGSRLYNYDLYAFVQDSPVNAVDFFGLTPSTTGPAPAPTRYTFRAREVVENGQDFFIIGLDVASGTIQDASEPAKFQLGQLKNFIQGAQQSGALHQMPADLNAKIGELARGDIREIRWLKPDRALQLSQLSAVLQIVQWLKWGRVGGEGQEKLGSVMDAAMTFRNSQTKASCEALCDSGVAFISSVPDASSGLTTRWFICDCYYACLTRFGANR